MSASAAPLEPSAPAPSPPGESQPARPSERVARMSTDPFGPLTRELATVLITVTIVALAAWMLVVSFATAGKQTSPQTVEAFTRQKDILLYCLSLLGTVMGYYFGRAPAELRANHAEELANTSQTQLTNAQDKLTTTTTAALEARRETDRIKADVKATLAPVVDGQAPGLLSEAAAGAGVPAPVLQDRIRRLLERIG